MRRAGREGAPERRRSRAVAPRPGPLAPRPGALAPRPGDLAVAAPEAGLPAPALRRAAAPSWVLAGATAAVGLLAAAVPALRSPLNAAAGLLSPALVALAVLRSRNRSARPWWLIALMLATWGAGTTLVQLDGSVGTPAAVLIDIGQAIAFGVVVLLARRVRGSRDERREDAVIDLLVIASVLTLVVLQLVAATSGTDGGRASRIGVVVPTVDVTILGLLLRVVVVRGKRPPAVSWGLAAAVGTVVYDLVSHLGGARLAAPGDANQVLGTVAVLAFAIAALHPSMTAVFQQDPTAARAPSVAVLGLLPLLTVPVALWGVARVGAAPGLPTPAYLAAGTLTAGLCLLRGSRALSRTEFLAAHDVLTGLLNRRGLAAAHAGAGPRGVDLLLVDVDEFKQVNDTHGHDVGDALLGVVRDRLASAAQRTGAGPVCRLGGDEFVVLASPGRGRVVAAAALEQLREPFDLAPLRLRVSASIGHAQADPAAPLSELLTRADVAMYAAKSAGRDRTASYDRELHRRVAQRFTLTAQLRRLLTEHDPAAGELAVHYQPLVDLATGTDVGAEALVRWDHPERGLVPPDEFLPLARAAGLDTELDTAVLDAVLDDLVGWRARGLLAVPVSLNLTSATLLAPGSAERIIGGLDVRDLPRTLLDVEITEHERLPQDGTLSDNLAKLHHCGVGIHLDDYGTGFTSLEYLRRFPIDVLKLDRSVLTDGDRGPDRLLRGVAAMADSLALVVLAEGVETAAQRDHLRAHGIRLGQGWLFGRAMSAEHWGDRLARAAPGTRLLDPVVLQTGDHPETAHAPGHRAGDGLR